MGQKRLFFLVALILSSCCILPASLNAKKPITSIRVFTDENDLSWFASNQLRLYAAMSKDNKPEVYTDNFNHGSFSWRRLNLQCDEGSFHDGVLTFDRDALEKSGYVIHIRVNHKRQAEKSFVSEIHLPHPVALEVSIASSEKLLPGAVIYPTIHVQFDNNKTAEVHLSYSGNEGASKAIALYQNNSEERDGVIHLPDFFPAGMDSVVIAASMRNNIDIYGFKKYPLDFSYTVFCQCNGMEGRAGSNGSSGSEGQAGSNGSNGQDGQDGSDVEVHYWMSEDSSRLHLMCECAGRKYYSLLKPGYGNVYIDARGGNGGKGGDGGRGGSAPEGSNGEGAPGGNGGYGGNGGDGGEITIYCSPAAYNYLQQITTLNAGGEGGGAGEGAKGGRNDNSNEKPTLLNALFPGKGAYGADAHSGYSGRSGGEPKLKFTNDIPDINR